MLQGDYNSFMGCLCAGEVSSVAWETIKGSVDASIIISDNAAKQTMKFLYDGIADGKRIKISQVDQMWSMGTPEELNNFLNNYKK